MNMKYFLWTVNFTEYPRIIKTRKTLSFFVIFFCAFCSVSVTFFRNYTISFFFDSWDFSFCFRGNHYIKKKDTVGFTCGYILILSCGKPLLKERKKNIYTNIRAMLQAIGASHRIINLFFLAKIVMTIIIVANV